MKTNNQDSIDRYLLNRMPVEERKSFEAKCAEDSELRDQLEHTRKVRTVISARSRILEMVQRWDEEYEAEEIEAEEKTANVTKLKATKISEVEDERKVAQQKRLYVYWLSGIAAVFVIGYFLFPTILPMSEKSEEFVSVNQNDIVEPQSDHTGVSMVNGTIEKHAGKEERENLLAKNDIEKKETKEEKMKVEKDAMSPLNPHVFSFGTEDFVKASPANTNETLEELKKVEAELRVITEKTSQNDLKFSSGAIDRDFYNTAAEMFKIQTDQLLWRKTKILRELKRTVEAITILDEMRKTKGQFQLRADSLYKELTK